MNRATCSHSVLVPDVGPIWKQRRANGPMVATCEKCGKVMKYSESTDVFGIRPALRSVGRDPMPELAAAAAAMAALAGRGR